MLVEGQVDHGRPGVTAEEATNERLWQFYGSGTTRRMTERARSKQALITESEWSK